MCDCLTCVWTCDEALFERPQRAVEAYGQVQRRRSAVGALEWGGPAQIRLAISSPPSFAMPRSATRRSVGRPSASWPIALSTPARSVGPHAVATGAEWQRRPAISGAAANPSGDARGNDRDDARAATALALNDSVGRPKLMADRIQH